MTIEKNPELGPLFPGFGYGSKKSTVINNYHAPTNIPTNQPDWYNKPPYWITQPPPWIINPPPWMNIPPSAGLPTTPQEPSLPPAPSAPEFQPDAMQQSQAERPGWRERYLPWMTKKPSPAPGQEIPVTIDPALARRNPFSIFRRQPQTEEPTVPAAMQEAVAETVQEEQAIEAEVKQLEKQTEENSLHQQELENMIREILVILKQNGFNGANPSGPTAPEYSPA